MRLRTGCQSCRDRHVRCVRPPGSKDCLRCLEGDRACFPSTERAFRAVSSVRAKTPSGRLSKQDLTYKATQVWVDVPSTVQFMSPDGNTTTTTTTTNQPGENGTELAVATLSETHSPNETARQRYPAELHSRVPPTQDSTQTRSEQRYRHEKHSHDAGGGSLSGYVQMDQSPHFSNHSNISIGPSPNISTHSPINIHQEHRSYSTISSPSSVNASLPFTSIREARFFHHYITHMAPWLDVCDRQCHFGREVPQRAMHYPVLANAIFALSSRHLNILTSSDDSLSPHYVGKCLQILITNLEGPLGHWDENFLAAVIILRSHEEMSDVDERCHLLGTTNLLNSISSFAADGGLREAASWASLRQQIYVSLTSQQPLAINLSTYRNSSAFSNDDNESISNRIVFIFASIITAAFHAENRLSLVQWEEFQREVNGWFTSKPRTFQPLWNPSTNRTDDVVGSESDAHIITTASAASGTDPWPELLMSHPAQVVGMQYYCLSNIILAIYDPRISKIGFSSHTLRKTSHISILENIRMVLGFAVSDKNVGNAMFQACHLLSACGSYLEDRREQDAAERFLSNMQRDMGWRTDHIIQHLREQWRS